MARDVMKHAILNQNHITQNAGAYYHRNDLKHWRRIIYQYDAMRN